jgi:integrase
MATLCAVSNRPCAPLCNFKPWVEPWVGSEHAHSEAPTKIATLVRERRAGLWADGGGLYLQITVGKTTSVAASWICRYQRLKRARDMGLGSFRDVSLAEARVLAANARKIARAGGDPIAAREAERVQKQLEAARTITFGAAVTLYLDAHRAGWRNFKHCQQWRNTLKAYASPRKLSVRDVDTAWVLKVIEPLWLTKTETARRLRNRVERVLDYAKARGYRSGDNPARWKGHLDALLSKPGKLRKVVHHAAMSYPALPAFMTALRAQQGIAPRALEFVILTGVRTGDLIGDKRNDKPPMRWAHVDLDNEIWTVPSTKTDREHKVPLSSPAVALLRAVKAQGLNDDIVFPDRQGNALHHGAMLKMLAAMGEPYAGHTVHGFRASFKTWASERTNFPREVIEASLAHKIGDDTESAYQRGDFLDKRWRLMNAWGGYCTSRPTSGKVLPIRK